MATLHAHQADRSASQHSSEACSQCHLPPGLTLTQSSVSFSSRHLLALPGSPLPKASPPRWRMVEGPAPCKAGSPPLLPVNPLQRHALLSATVLHCISAPPALQTGTSHAGVRAQLCATPAQSTAPPKGAWDTGGWALDAWEAPSASAPSPAVKSVSQVIWLPSTYLLYLHLYRHAWQDIRSQSFRSKLSLQAEAKAGSAHVLPKRETASEGTEASAPWCSQPGKTLLRCTSSVGIHHHVIMYACAHPACAHRMVLHVAGLRDGIPPTRPRSPLRGPLLPVSDADARPR